MNLPALYASEQDGVLEIAHEATAVHFDQAGVIRRVVARLTADGKKRLLGSEQ